MVQQRNWMRAGNPLIYLGIVVLAFFIGTLFGLIVLRWWLWFSAPPAPSVTFVTTTPGPPSVGLVATPPACDATPVDWVPYTIQADDTLSELAARIGISQNRLLRANCLTSPDLLAGQVLYLPSPPTPTPCVLSPPSSWGVYIVQAGDALFDLAAARGITTDQVIRINCLASTDIREGQQLYLPILPTPTPCVPSPPLGWDLDTVQAGDTLFSLATARGVTTAEVMQVNCLTSEDLQEGQQLYLPILPTPTPTQLPTSTPQPVPLAQIIPNTPLAAPPLPAPVPQPPVTGALVESEWNKRDQTLNPIPIPIGLPGDTYRPCRNPTPPPDRLPRISSKRAEVSPLPTPDRYNLEQGEREYYYACDFPDPATLTARIIGPDGPHPLNVQLYLPLREDRYEVMNDQPQGVVVFNAICDISLSSEVPYTLVMEDRQGGYADHKFKVKPANIERILIVPQAGPPGTTYQVYYCGYTSQTNQYIDIDLFYDITDKPPVNLSTTAIHATSWTVFINKDGQGKQDLPSLPTDPIGRYFVRDRSTFGAVDVVWLLPNR